MFNRLLMYVRSSICGRDRIDDVNCEDVGNENDGAFRQTYTYKIGEPIAARTIDHHARRGAN